MRLCHWTFFAFESRRFPGKRKPPITYHDFFKEERDPNLLLFFFFFFFSKEARDPCVCLFPTLLLFRNEYYLSATSCSKAD